MLSITPSRSSLIGHPERTAPAALAPVPTTIRLVGAANAPQGKTVGHSVGGGVTGRTCAAPVSFTFDEAFPSRDLQRDPSREGTGCRDAGALSATPASLQAKQSLRARFASAFVFGSRKLLLDRIYNGWCAKQEGAQRRAEEGVASREHPQNASSLLKTTAREMKAILHSLESPTPTRTNDKQRHHVKHQLSESDKSRLYGAGRLSVDQRLMLYAFPNIKTFIARCDQDFSYGERDVSSSRRLLFERTIKVVQTLDSKVERMEKLIVDTYMQHEHHTPSGDVLGALLEPEIVGRLLEITRGMTPKQQRAAALAEIRQVCEMLVKEHPEIGKLLGTLESVNSKRSRLNMPAITPVELPRKPLRDVAARANVPAPSPSSVAVDSTSDSRSHSLTDASAAANSPSSAPAMSAENLLSRNAAFQRLLGNFPSYTELREGANSALPVPAETLTETPAHQADPQRPISMLATLRERFRSFFSYARKRCAPDLESRTVQRQWQTQRLQAAAVAYDKITDQATDIFRTLSERRTAASIGTSDRSITDDDRNRLRHGSATGETRIAGVAMDALLRDSKLTLDLGRQLSLHALLSASDSHTLQLATTYDMDAVHALEASGRLRPDQRGLLYGLDALVSALAQIPASLKQRGSDAGTKFERASDALAQLVDLQSKAHDTLTHTCVTAGLTVGERIAIFKDRTVTHVMEATSGYAPRWHNAICRHIVGEAQRNYAEEPVEITRL